MNIYIMADLEGISGLYCREAKEILPWVETAEEALFRL